MRTPGVTLFRSGEYSFDGLATAGDATASLAFFDPDPRFDYELPFQARLGAAMGARALPARARRHFRERGARATIFFERSGRRPSSWTTAAARPSSSSVPSGGHRQRNRRRRQRRRRRQLRPDPDKVWKLHFGFNTDFSPVGDNDEFFSRVDLYSLTAGISGTVQGFTAALGVNYEFGDANNVPLADILDSDITIDSVAIIYSIAYKF